MLHIMKLRLICRRVAALVIAVAACLFSRQLRIQMSYSTIHVQYEHLSHIILASQILVHSASFIFPSAVVGIIASQSQATIQYSTLSATDKPSFMNFDTHANPNILYAFLFWQVTPLYTYSHPHSSVLVAGVKLLLLDCLVQNGCRRSGCYQRKSGNEKMYCDTHTQSDIKRHN